MINIRRTYFRSGEKTGVLPTTAGDLLPKLPAKKDRLVVFTWPKLPWFTLRSLALAEDAGNALQFTQDIIQYQKMLHEMHAEITAHDAVLRGKLAVFAAIVPADSRGIIRIAASVNTNQRDYVKACEALEQFHKAATSLGQALRIGVKEVLTALELEADGRPSPDLERAMPALRGPHKQQRLNTIFSVLTRGMPPQESAERQSRLNTLFTGVPWWKAITRLPDGEPGIRLGIKVDGYVRGQIDIQDANDLLVNIKPARQLPRYAGYMALDFGNTSSTLVRLPDAQDNLSDLQVINLHLPSQDSKKNVPTTLLVDKYLPPPSPAVMARVGFRVGVQAGLGDLGGLGELIIGVKRMLVDPDPASYQLTIENKTHAIQKQLPGELLISRLLGRVGELADDQPYAVGPLAVTYPTTYSGWEVSQLQSTVYYAIRRALGVENYYKHDVKPPPGVPPLSKEEVKALTKEKQAKVKAALPLLIDEASAASIFYLYKDFVKCPGSIRAMRYLYPKGLRILLYDCGGGTTDVALVQATGAILPDEVGKSSYRLKIEVLGRTGHRNFGGDRMTIAVFKLLKARIAERVFRSCSESANLSNVRPEELKVPTEVNKLAAHLNRTASIVNRIVPTKFDELGEFDEFLELRKNAVRDIWDWAEKIKESLSTSEQVDKELLTNGSLLKLLASVHGMDGDEPFHKPLRFTRNEIDVLVTDEINESIDKVNHMLEKKLGANAEVDCVYVVGNASRYPRVCEQLRKRLKIRFIDERLRFDGDPLPDASDDGPDERVSDLKDAVAKGACLALMLQTEHRELNLEFDQEIVHKLPYDIVIPTLGEAVSPPPIFEEGEHCHFLEPHIAPAPTAPEGKDRPRTMPLQRRWPGDKAAESYLIFDFEREIEGQISIAYDVTRSQFTMQDALSAKPVYGKQILKAEYVSPIQSGEL